MLELFKSNKKTDTDKIKILFVDDEPDLLNTVQYRLSQNSYEVVTASNGKEGLEVAKEAKPDLILLDNNMPIMSGQEMLTCLRNDAELKDIPVIMLTALCEAQDIAKALSYGISDYVTKPFEYSELVEKIKNALAK